MPPFNHGFNINQPQIFYQRPAHNPHVFYHRPVTINPHIYVPVQRQVHIHPPTHSQVQQQPVFGYPPSHVHQHPQQHPDVPRGAPVGPAQTPAHVQENIPQDRTLERECQLNEPVVSEIQTQQSSREPSPIEISPERTPARRDSDNICNDSTFEVAMSTDVEATQGATALNHNINRQLQSNQKILPDIDQESNGHLQGDTYENQGSLEK